MMLKALGSFVLPLGLVVSLTSCVSGDSEDGMPSSRAIVPMRDLITTESLLSNIEILAHDSMEGRAPGSVGEERTVRYLIDRFKSIGLSPGNPDGSWEQKVSLMGITSRPSAELERNGTKSRLAFPRDYVVGSKYPDSLVTLNNSDLVFVGYGVVAPELGWDDYKDIDVTGKTVVILVNDPPVPLEDGSGLDPAVFKGEGMSYYGRWTYKFDMASAKGAAGALIVHETEPAGYPYLVVISSWGRESFDVNIPGGPQGRVKVEGWLARPAAESIFADAGLNFDSLKTSAASRDFRPVEIGSNVSFSISNSVREVESTNVVGKIEGADTKRSDEWVIYSAHWDHLGRDSMHEGDQIFNGAIDNASGISSMLEIAGAMSQLPIRMPRSVLFVALTAEEQGLLGARWYNMNPLYPHEKVLANINLDGINQWGRTRDITVIGSGSNTIEDILRVTVERDGRTLSPDPEPEKGFLFRSDHFEFARKGIPVLFTGAGSDYIDRPAGFGAEKRAEYNANDYHKPSDEIKPDWDLSGAVEDAKALLEVGWRLSYANTWPVWREGSEFKAIRDSSLASSSSGN